MTKKVVSAILTVIVIFFITLLNIVFMRLTHEALFESHSKSLNKFDKINEMDSVLSYQHIKENVKCIYQNN